MFISKKKFYKIPYNKLLLILIILSSVQLIRKKIHNDTSIATKHFHKLGDHIIAEFMGCRTLTEHKKLIQNNTATVVVIENILKKAIKAAGATLVAIKVHTFDPIGLTAVAVLQESHIAIHTWPEHGYIAIDIFTCGTHVKIQKALSELKHFFKPTHSEEHKLDRGFYEYH